MHNAYTYLDTHTHACMCRDIHSAYMDTHINRDNVQLHTHPQTSKYAHPRTHAYIKIKKKGK